MPRQIMEIKDFLLTARRKDAKCKLVCFFGMIVEITFLNITTFIGIFIKTHITAIEILIGVYPTDVLSRWDHLIKQ